VSTRTQYPQQAGDAIAILAHLTVLAGLVAGMLVGSAVIAVYGPAAAIIFTGVLGAVLVTLVPAHISVWVLFITVLLIVGPLVYFARIEKAFWIPFFMSTLLVAKVFFELPRIEHDKTVQHLRTPVFVVGLYAFMALFFTSTLLNQTNAFGAFIASKNYLFIWSITFLIGLGALAERSLERIWKFFLWVSMLQLPFAVIQRALYARRSGMYWDAIVGTFGGNPEGGGASGAMALFLVFSMLLASRLYSSSRISGLFHWTVIICALTTIALAEVKVIFVLLPIGYAWMYRKEIPRHLGRTLLMGTLMCLVLAAIFLIYKTSIYNEKNASESLVATIERLFTREGRLQSYDPRTGDVSRTEALARWWALNPVSEPQFVFGHGPAASRISQTAGAGAAAVKYPFNLTTSTASVLLWELGVTGYALFLFILFSAAYSAEKSARNCAVPAFQRCMLQVNAAALLLVALLTVYNRQAVDSPSVQVLIAAMLGHVLFMARKYTCSPHALSLVIRGARESKAAAH
jgi:hypothetical protein